MIFLTQSKDPTETLGKYAAKPVLTAIVTRANAVITAVGLVQHSRGVIEEWGPPVHTLNASAADDAHAIPIHAFCMVLERIFTARFCVVNPPLIK